MERIPYRSERGLGALQHQMNRLFEDFFGEGSWPSLFGRAEWAPALDISENDEEFLVTAEVPGISRENIDISVTGNMLTLKGEKRAETTEEEHGSYHRVERSFGSFLRTVALPSTVDPGNVRANMKDGVLEIHLAKKEESKPRQIAVHVD